MELTEGVGGGTSNIEPAMESGQFDLYPEYTGTGWAMVLKNEGSYTEDEFDQLQAGYQNLDMSWVGMYGFGNTYGVAVREDIAQNSGLKTYSDLARVAGRLTLGAEADFFEREDGYDALSNAYGMNIGNTMQMDIGLKYDALAQGSVDAIVQSCPTDGKLSTADATVLTDDEGFFPSYQCGNVVRNQVLQQHPELRDVLDKLQGTISDQDMARMNYEVEAEGDDQDRSRGVSQLEGTDLMNTATIDDVAVEYRDVCKSYGEKNVLEHLNIQNSRGEFVTMIGSSGSGKTTALKMVNRLIEPTSGTILVNGRNVRDVDPIQLRRNIGYAIQGSVLFPHMTVEDNISYVPNLLNKRDHERTRKAVRTWMDIVGLSKDLLERYPSELSGGQQQRVGIARALAASPDILLMDEPFGAVDEITRGQLQVEISRIHREAGITVMFVTHDIGEALRLGTRVLVLDAGKIQQYGAPEEILARPATAFVEQLVSRQRHACDLPEDQLCACAHSGASRAEAALAAK